MKNSAHMGVEVVCEEYNTILHNDYLWHFIDLVKRGVLTCFSEMLHYKNDHY